MLTVDIVCASAVLTDKDDGRATALVERSPAVDKESVVDSDENDGTEANDVVVKDDKC